MRALDLFDDLKDRSGAFLGREGLGCCDEATGGCLNGTAPGGCGSEGNICANCALHESCVEGSCQCDPQCGDGVVCGFDDCATTQYLKERKISFQFATEEKNLCYKITPISQNKLFH